MRHPFWKWAGLLGVSLAGCLHSPDSRDVLSRPLADRQGSQRPITVGPRQLKREPTKSSAKNTIVQNVGKEAAKEQHVAPRDPRPVARENTGPSQDAQLIQTKYVPPAAPASEPVSTPTPPMPLPEPARFVPAPTTSVKPATRAISTPETRPFAEFERAVPLRGSRNAESSAIVVEPQSPRADSDKIESAPSSPPSEEKRVAAEPQLIHRDGGIFARRDDFKRLRDQASGQTKELSDVANSSGTTIRATESTTRTRDVAQLVEQVFEDLRQHRLTEARERTEQLKRLVARSSTAESVAITADSPAQPANAAADHPVETHLPETSDESHVDATNDAVHSTDESENETIVDDEMPTQE